MSTTSTEITQLTAQQQAWAQLPLQKNAVANELQNMELSAQRFLQLAETPNSPYELIDTNLNSYKKLYAEMVDKRKPFTSMITERIINPLMEFEKRVDPAKNATYLSLAARSLQLRKQKETEVANANAKEQEKVAFQTHVVNEYHRVVEQYRNIVRDFVLKNYTANLLSKISDVTGIVQDLKKQISQIKPPPFVRYMPKFITEAEMNEIYSAVPPPKWNDYYNELMGEVDTTFSNYESDLANASEAILAQEQQVALKNVEDSAKTKEAIAIDTLTIRSEAVIIDAPVIKKSVKVVELNTEEWSMAIIVAYVKNRTDLIKYFRVKTWSKLSLGQIADALGKLATETGLQFDNLQLEEICK